MNKWRVWAYKTFDDKPVGKRTGYILDRYVYLVIGGLLVLGVVALVQNMWTQVGIAFLTAIWLGYMMYSADSESGIIDAEHQQYLKNRETRWQKIREQEAD